MIPYGRQDISQADIDAVVDVLKSDFLTQGDKVPEFENALCVYTDAKHACVTNSATSALHVACLALEVGPGDLVWTTPITYVATANCARYCGADVDFVDIDPATGNISTVELSHKLATAKTIGRLPKVLIPVHLCGEPCDMRTIAKLADEYEFAVIEDASHAIGGRYESRKIGACEFSDITVFSFHPVKIITTAEGGAALTNQNELAKKMAVLRSHGVTRDQALMVSESHGPWYYQQIDLGYNYRMTELQAALGVSQLARIDDYIAARHALSDRYDELLKELPISTLARNGVGYSGMHLYVIRLAATMVGRREQIFRDLRAAGIGVNVHYIPVHIHPYYQGLGFTEGYLPEAEAYYRSAISLPLYPGLQRSEQDSVVSALADALS